MQPTLGVYDEFGYERLDYTFWKAKQLGLRLFIHVVNNWGGFSGMNWYVLQTGGGHDGFHTRDSIKTAYRNYISLLPNRFNSLTGVSCNNESAIFSWELANEPHCSSDVTGNMLDGITISGLLPWDEARCLYLPARSAVPARGADHSGHVRMEPRQRLIAGGAVGW